MKPKKDHPWNKIQKSPATKPAKKFSERQLRGYFWDGNWANNATVGKP